MSAKRRSEVVAIYCPLWHNYDHASSWKGEGWCEWELVKDAIPRFKGHYQPLRPSWGCFDESDPKWSRREIDLAADNGVDVFLVDWYWYSGVRIMEEALERGLLKAGNRRRLKFALMWANHPWADYFPAPFGQKWNSWLPSRHSEADWFGVMDYCIEHYLRQPNYWRYEDRLFFSIFQPERLVEELGGPKAMAGILRRTDQRLRRAKLPPLHANAMVWGPKPVAMLREAGFGSTTQYTMTPTGPKLTPKLTMDYRDMMQACRESWARIAQEPLPYFPIVPMGWDVTARCEKNVPWPFPPPPGAQSQTYPYIGILLNNTPKLFGQLCAEAREFADGRPIFINAWNEWTEGSYLLPEKKTGTAYLKAIKKALG